MHYLHMSYLKRHVILSILTPLFKKSVKKWRGAGQNRDWEGGPQKKKINFLLKTPFFGINDA